VQPYLKKCFEGIYRLQFTKEEVVTGIISAENEIVPLSEQIIPADAKVQRPLYKVYIASSLHAHSNFMNIL
jgi:hypothetical protein